MKEKAKIPSPDKYLCNVHKTHFNDMNKKSKIYAFDRKSSINEICKAAKETPGTGRYDNMNFDEKYERPPKGIHKVSQERVTIMDEAQTHGKLIPDKYNDVELVSFFYLFNFM